MIKVKINGKSYDFPTGYEDLTVSQYIQILDSSSLSDQVAIFTGLNKESIRNATILGLEALISVLNFLKTPPTFTVPNQIGSYKVPRNVTFESLGQFEDLRHELKRWPKKDLNDFNVEDSKTLIDMYLSACAIYCQKLRDKQYDNVKANEMKAELSGYKVTEIIGAGSFFLAKPLSLLNGTMKTSPNTSPPSRKKKPVLPKSRKRSGSTRH